MSMAPVLATLRHHKVTVVLLMLQVAFTCAIVCNTVFLIAQRVERITVPSGLDEGRLSLIRIDDLGIGDAALDQHRSDLAVLRSLPQVQSAAVVDNVPLTGNQDAGGVCGSLAAVRAARTAKSIKVAGCATADEYAGSPGMLGTLGLRLVAGRDFSADEFVSGKPGHAVNAAPAVIISQALVRRLYPEHPAHVVGRSVYFGGSGFRDGQGTRIVGVVEHLQRGNLTVVGDNDLSMLLPVTPANAYVTFALRSESKNRSRVLHAAKAALERNRPGRQVSTADTETYAQIRAAYFSRDTTMIALLLAAALGLLFVTALGIAGLAGFWVQQRTRSIGIRRAVGATRGDILHYFQIENFLIVSAGVILGMILATGLSLLLMQHYAVPRLPFWYLPVGAVLLWVLGQLAVLTPALRAASVPPVVATRSV